MTRALPRGPAFLPALRRPGIGAAGARHASVLAIERLSVPAISVDDPATPHSRIIHKESKVIRLVQCGGQINFETAKLRAFAPPRDRPCRAMRSCRQGDRQPRRGLLTKGSPTNYASVRSTMSRRSADRF